jgi:hypothetical protein
MFLDKVLKSRKNIMKRKAGLFTLQGILSQGGTIIKKKKECRKELM